MPRRKKRPELTFLEKIRKIKKAGIENYKPVNMTTGEEDLPMEDIPSRVRKILGIVQSNQISPLDMIYFVMYDIENDKIRNLIAKYLIQKGCIRVQKSIFLARSERKIFDEIHQTLKEVQEMYENQDSIIMVPVSTEQLRAMQLIGQNVDFTVVTDPPKIQFF